MYNKTIMDIILKINGRKIIKGRTAAEIVASLIDLQWPKPDGTTIDVVEYMQDAAWRAKQQHGAIVRTDTPDNFIDDLVKAGVLERAQQ